MKTYIYCKEKTHGMHTFYLNYGDNDYFLFNQSYKVGVNDFYSKGVILEKSMQTSLAHRDFGILKTMEKLPKYIKFIEKEEGIYVMKNTIEKSAA